MLTFSVRWMHSTTKLKMLITKFIVGLTFLIAARETSAKVGIFFDDTIEDCTEEGDNAGYYDLSQLEIFIESDTDIYLNGTVKFLQEITSPWKTEVKSDEYVRSEWVPSVVQRKIPDFCAVLHSPIEPWYNFMKDLTGCPISAGVRKTSKNKLKIFSQFLFNRANGLSTW
jgi:hypothetical protein